MPIKNRTPGASAKHHKQANKTQTTQSQKGRAAKAHAKAVDSIGQPAMVHDLHGGVVISLPLALRTIIGEQAYRACCSELRAKTATLILRESGVVVYVSLHLRVEDPLTGGAVPPKLDRHSNRQTVADHKRRGA